MRAPDLIETDDTFVIGKSRSGLALEVLAELAALCDLLRVATRRGSDDEKFVVRGLSMRMNELVDAVTAAISDVHDKTDDIAARVGIERPALPRAQDEESRS